MRSGKNVLSVLSGCKVSPTDFAASIAAPAPAASKLTGTHTGKLAISAIRALAGESDIVRVSDEDLGYLFPGIDQLEAEKKLLNICKGSLIVTRGAEGSTWYNKGRKTFRVDAPCFKAGEVVDTIGCGDTFDGAVMAWLERNGFVGNIAGLERDDVSRILDYASKAAGLNCLFEGCNPPSRVGNADDME